MKKKTSKKEKPRIEENVELIARHLLDIDKRFSKELSGIKDKVNKIESHISGIDGNVSGIEFRLSKVETKLDSIQETVEGIDDRLNTVENKVITK